MGDLWLVVSPWTSGIGHADAGVWGWDACTMVQRCECFGVWTVLGEVGLVRSVIILAIGPVLLVSSFLRRLCYGVTRLDMKGGVLLLLVVFLGFVTRFVGLKFGGVYQTTVSSFFITTSFLSRFKIGVAEDFAMFANGRVLGFLNCRLVTFTRGSVRGKLDTSSLQNKHGRKQVATILAGTQGLNGGFVGLVFLAYLLRLVGGV